MAKIDKFKITIRSCLIRAGQIFKWIFIRFKLHIFAEPFVFILLKICFLSKLSKWISTNRALISSNDFKVCYDKRYELYKLLTDAEQLSAIDYLEFGVGSGHSFRWWVDNNKNAASRFFGFDTFTGLPEDWGLFKAGAFSTGGNTPKFKDCRCHFYKGLFQNTLKQFLASYRSKGRRVIHLDADLYGSTLFVLTSLVPVLQAEDILIFDEFGVPTGEFRAFTDFISAYRVKYKVLGTMNNYLQVVIKLI